MIKKILNILLFVGVVYVVVSAFLHYDQYHSLLFHFEEAAVETEEVAPAPVAQRDSVKVEKSDSLTLSSTANAVEDSLAHGQTVRDSVCPKTAPVAPHTEEKAQPSQPTADSLIK